MRQVSRSLRLLLVSLFLGALVGCGGSKVKPINPGSVRISSSSSTPPHRMSKYDYPFDSRGNYIESWAKAGEQRKGRTAYVKQAPSYSSSSRSRSSRSSSSRYHTVGRGDTLWGISKRYGKSVSSIKSANRLRSDTIRLGQRLRIP